MANEYLTRTPTSSGNRSVFTWAGWVKISDSISAATSIFGSFFGGSSRYTSLSFNSSSQLQFFTGDYDVINSSTPYQTWFITDRKFRDFGSWIHIMLIYDTSDPIGDDRCKIYVNGSKVEIGTRTATASLGDVGFFNTTIPHYLGTWSDPANNGGQYAKGEMFDVFLVDGQALTPDVFGFYKDGDGYMSSGNTQATDFKPGQWSPRLPKSIKYTINRSGGFGVNGYYLPMNDSSNPGADFHCDPNSIITLKGEDLPQPQNGAPITSDVFVSQLRQETGTLGFDGVVAFDGTGDYLTPPGNTDFTLGTGDFTIECWVYPKTYGGIFQFFDSSILDNSTSGPAIGIDVNDNSWAIRYGASSTLDTTNIATLNVWSHIAYVRNSSVTRLYVNGKEIGSVSDSTDYSANYPVIGGWYNTSFLLNGFISNFRVVKGTAVYTANFTAPTEPLTNITNTKLLCCQSSTDATAAAVIPTGTITVNGDVFATRNELTGSIVFAIPGISTATGGSIISNGNFDSNITGWGAGNGATLSHQFNGPNGSGNVNVQSPGGSNGYAAQTNTTIANKRYTLSFYYQHVSGQEGYYNVSSGAIGGSDIIYKNLGTGSDWQLINVSFTATSTSTFTGFYSRGSAGVTRFANISLVQEDEARDYSADIRGSGTNKTLNTVTYLDTNNSQWRSPAIVSGHSPYGSFINYDSPANTGGFIEVPDATAFDNVNLTTAEWTYEAWYKRGTIGSGASNLIQFGNTTDYQAFGISLAPTGRLYYVWSYDGSSWGVLSNSDGPVIPQDEWCHIAIVKEATPTPRIITYVNGVFAKSVTLTSNISYTSPDYMRIGGHYRGTAGGGDTYFYNGGIFDAKFYKIVKYKGSFDVPKPYAPVGIEAFRTTTDTCKNNFATFNPLKTTPNQTLTEGNLHCAQAGQVWGSASSSIAIEESSGKFYAEWRVKDTNYSYIGMTNADSLIYVLENLGAGMTYLGATANDWGYLSSNGSIQHNGGTLSSGDGTLAAGDIVGITFDSSNKQCKWYKNGVLKHTATLTGNYPFYFSSGSYVSANTVNFGQNPSFGGRITAGTNADDSGKGLFKYAPPSGFLALCTDNLPTPVIADPGNYFKSVFYTGDGIASHSITGVGFKPDFVWLKGRTGSSFNHVLCDSVRGSMSTLFSNNSLQEYTDRGVRTFDDDGFTLSVAEGDENNSGIPYVAWCWKAGGPAVSNTEGNITTQVSANPTAGFSIVKSNGPGTSGHGLNSTPKFIIQKSLTSGNWNVAHCELYAPGGTGKILLNLTDKVAPSSTTYMHSATATTFDPLFSAEQIAYVWAEIEGYSKFGSYTGNGDTNGPFVYCGFKPAWVLVKNIDSDNSHWVLWDSSRTPYNEMQNALRPNSIDPETSGFQFDFLSNGFKVRDGELSVSEEDDKFIFAAFAESPFSVSNAK